MRIIAILDEIGHAHIFAGIRCAQFSNYKPIHFIVDTGCSITTILNDDVTRLGVDCTSLSRAQPTNTANGQITPYVLPDVTMKMAVFSGLFNRKREFRDVFFQAVQCNQPTQPHLMTPERISHSCSILGMDFLRLFPKWRFTDTHLFLDT